MIMKLIEAIIEMPKGSYLKYEFNKEENILFLDRVLGQPIPYNYGFIPNTLSEDGDPLDIFVITEEPIYPLTKVRAEIIAGIKCMDGGVSDDKLIAILHSESYEYPSIAIHSLIRYLETYKFNFSVEKILDETESLRVYEESLKKFLNKN